MVLSVFKEAGGLVVREPWTNRRWAITHRREVFIMLGAILGGPALLFAACILICLFAKNASSALYILVLYWVLFILVLLFEAMITPLPVFIGVLGIILSGFTLFRVILRFRRHLSAIRDSGAAERDPAA
jgi:hypothetical protein